MHQSRAALPVRHEDAPREPPGRTGAAHYRTVPQTAHGPQNARAAQLAIAVAAFFRLLLQETLLPIQHILVYMCKYSSYKAELAICTRDAGKLMWKRTTRGHRHTSKPPALEIPLS